MSLTTLSLPAKKNVEPSTGAPCFAVQLPRMDGPGPPPHPLLFPKNVENLEELLPD